MKARHRAAKGTKYSYEDHYEDDYDYFSDGDDSYTASQRRDLDMLLCNHLEAHLYTSDGTGNGKRGKAI